MSETQITTSQESTSLSHKLGYAALYAFVIAVGLGVGSFIGFAGSLLTGIIPSLC